MGISTSYSHAAPYIRESLMRATAAKLNASTIRDRREHSGQMYAFVNALDILRRSPEGKNSPSGYPPWFGGNEQAVLAEIERYVGGEHRMRELGFIDD